jgi:2-polyprenyl-3-methyl-5-hydroxy-6-metoxy-1,4-benzoquinol methylase
MITEKEQVREYYDRIKDNFDDSYEEGKSIYPSNRYRIELALEVLRKNKANRVLDAGCGTGVPLLKLLTRGFDAEGFDFSEEAVAVAKKRLAENGYSPERVWVGDIEKSNEKTLALYDAVLCIGALTHPMDEEKSLGSMRKLLRPGGVLIVELRNELFSLFTFNNYTRDFFKKILFSGSDLSNMALEQMTRSSLIKRAPFAQVDTLSKTAEEFFSVPSVWKNPLTIDAEYAEHGLKVIDKLFFHWHAVPPMYEPLDPAAFRVESKALEKFPHDWRGHFMCSAFLVVCSAT